MKLRAARLCLDCEEMHDQPRCPACTSETFVYMTRWVPEPDPRAPRPQAATSPDAEVYKELVGTKGAPPANRKKRGRRLLKSGVISLAAVGVVGWFLGGRRSSSSSPSGPPLD